jgi:hypothetical protein
MYLLIRYPIGVIVEAVVLAKGRNSMRVAAAGFPDALELTRSGRQWFTKDREPVEFDFLMSNDHQARNVSSSMPARVAALAAAAIQN